jgi:arylformamidase
MPYIISQSINESIPPLWFEGKAYKKENLYSISAGKMPPVNYDSHILNSHSLTHIEAQTHVTQNGKSLDHYFEHANFFYGPALVIKLKGNHYSPHWEVTKDELQKAIENELKEKTFPGKLLLTTENYPLTSYGYHDPDAVLTLSQEAADYLITLPGFNLYGTTWKSSDYKPGSPERPIHKTLFQKAVILECLDLTKVPEGIYFLTTFPLKIEGASESPVCPVLFTKDELTKGW